MDIDRTRIDEIAQRFPVLPRSRIELAVEAYGADEQELERALHALSQAESMRVLRSGQAPLN